VDKPKSIAEWMSARGIDLPKLLDASGLDRRVVTAIMQGHYTTSPQQRQRLAAALGVAAEAISWGQSVQVDHIYGHGPQFGRSP